MTIDQSTLNKGQIRKPWRISKFPIFRKKPEVHRLTITTLGEYRLHPAIKLWSHGPITGSACSPALVK